MFYLNIIQKMKGEWYNQEGASPILSLITFFFFAFEKIQENLSFKSHKR